MASYDDLRAAAAEAWKAAEDAAAAAVRRLDEHVVDRRPARATTLAALREIGARDGFDVAQTGDTGLAWAEPVVEVRKPGGERILYGNVTADNAASFADRSDGRRRERARHRRHRRPASTASPRSRPSTGCSPQTRWLMHNCGVIDPDSIDHYIARGGYGTFVEAVADVDRDELIEVDQGLDAAGPLRLVLLDRHQVGLPARRQRAEPKYLVCNADEGDPGAWVNRVLMESDPHSHHRGHAHRRLRHRRDARLDLHPRRVPARHRAHAPRHRAGARAAASSARTRSAPASSSMRRSIRGAGAYVCGDETGLISSINDDRGMPRIKPPFPAQSGVLEQPTNVNNVETYACVTTLLRVTPETYSTVGTENEPRHEDVHGLRRVRRRPAASKSRSARP